MPEILLKTKINLLKKEALIIKGYFKNLSILFFFSEF